jgi:two-component system copper resistance phosphate regulon response regulator CusR
LNTLPFIAEANELGSKNETANQFQKPRNSTNLAEFNRTTTRRVLMIDEDASLSGFISSELKANGFAVDLISDGEAALGMLLNERSGYDLLILELNLPKIDGISLIKHIRPTLPRLPVLVVTARNRTEDKVTALVSGADDCLTKPISLAELLARVRALLRRNFGPISNYSIVGDLTLHREERRVERNGRRIELTPREFALLDVMMQNAGHPVPRSTLFERVWNASSEPSTNIVDVYMKYVRDKVDLPGEPKLVHTVRGFGYELRMK